MTNAIKTRIKTCDSSLRVDTLFSIQLDQHQNKVALISSSIELTYAQLDHYSTMIANELSQKIEPGEVIALLLPREPLLVVVILAILKAGGVYLPIDTTCPDERVAFLLKDSRARLLICSDNIDNSLLQTLQQSSHFLDEVMRFNLLSDDQLCVKSMACFQHEAVSKPQVKAAYIMYTSGSTGLPKGVLIGHQGIINLVKNQNYISLNDETRLLQAGAVGFDASTFEIWGALLNGGRLYFVKRDVLLDACALEHFLNQHQINTAFLTAALFIHLANQNAAIFQGIHQLMVGGDVVPANQAQKVRKACPKIRIINGYGPTENTVFSLTHDLTDIDTTFFPIGKPINNTTAYVLDINLNQTKIGEIGELYVGGAGIGLGYLNNPELSQRKFIANPFIPAATLFATGDQARRLANGNLELLGRLDNQVKINGFRVESGEIEARLRLCKKVNDTAVIAKKRPDKQEPTIWAFVVLEGGNASLPAVKKELMSFIPDYMIPSQFICLDSLPVNQNGKIDSQTLQNIEPFTDNFNEPSLEKPINIVGIIELAKKTFAINEINLEDNLFELGVNSLTLASFACEIEQLFNTRLPVSYLFAAPTLLRVVSFVQENLKNAHSESPKISRAKNKALYPVSPQQKMIYVDQIKYPSSTHYNLPMVLDLPSDISVSKLKLSLAELVKKHDILRTQFLHIQNETYQQIMPQIALDEAFIQIAASEDKDDLSKYVHFFNLEKAPLWRVYVIEKTPDKLQMIFDIHHLLTDGFSLVNLFNEWSATYANRPLGDNPLQYKDFVEWHYQAVSKNYFDLQRDYWLNLFNKPLPITQLPTDFKRVSTRNPQGGYIDFYLGSNRTTALNELARQKKITLYSLLLAIYSLFLARITHQKDISIGTAAFCRNLQGSEKIQGMFANTLCLRLQLHPEDKFSSYLEFVASQVMEAFQHQNYPFEYLVQDICKQRDLGSNPLFETFFALQNTPPLTFLDRIATWTPWATKATPFDLNLQIIPVDNDLRAYWGYSSELFLIETIQGFKLTFLDIVDAVLADSNLRLYPLVTINSNLEESNAVKLNNSAISQEPVTHNLIESVLIKIWEDVLTRQHIGIHDNFFALGGNSIHFVSVLAKSSQHHLHFSFQQFFSHPTIASLSQTIVSNEKISLIRQQYAPFELLTAADRGNLPDGIEDAYPLSMLQAGLIFQNELTFKTTQYHDIVSYMILSPLEIPEFKEAVRILVKNNPVFRTSYHLSGYDHYLQMVHREATSPLFISDLRHLNEEQQQNWYLNWLEEEKAFRFVWEKPGCMIRLHIHRLKDDLYRYTLSQHNSALDGWSVVLVHKQLFEIYHQLLAKKSYDKPAVDNHLRHYIGIEQTSINDPATKMFWSDVLNGAIYTHIPAWPLETDKKIAVHFHEVAIPISLSNHIITLADHLGVPVKCVLMAAHIKVLSLFSGETDVMTGYEHSGRPELDGATEAIGLFLNTLPFRVKISEGSWQELINHVYQTEAELLPHRRYPMAKMKQDLNTQTSFFETVFNFTHFYMFKELKKLPEFSLLDIGVDSVTEFSLRAEFSRHFYTDHVKLCLHYHASTFPEKQIALIGSHYLKILNAMVLSPQSEHLSYRFSDRVIQINPVKNIRFHKALPDHQKIKKKHVKPMDFIAKKIAATWSLVLHIEVDEISMEDNFFDLGGSSLSALQVAMNHKELFSLSDLMQNSKLADLVSLITEKKNRINSSLIQKLSPQDESAEYSLLCFPYAGGNAINFYPLALELAALNPKIAVYTVELPGHDFINTSQSHFKDVLEVAQLVFTEVLHQIKGPVLLWGHCSGSAFALETARLLTIANVDVKHLFIGSKLLHDERRLLYEIELIKTKTDRQLVDWMINDSGYAELNQLKQPELAAIAAAFRYDSCVSKRYFANALSHKWADKCTIPLTVVIAKDDMLTREYQDCYKNWSIFSDSIHLKEIVDGGHYFCRTRPAQVANIILETCKLAISSHPGAKS